MSSELERELASGGFCWEPKRKPFSVAGMKLRRKRKGKRARIAPSMTPSAVYKRAQRARWIAMGIVKPRTPEEVALAEVAQTLTRIGDGPLAVWMAA